jgi:Ca2+-binding RTX toxin-like protein
VNETQGSGYGQTSFYALSVSHDVSTSNVHRIAASIIRGDAGKDTVRGKVGADILYGGSGNDVLYGGKGKDAFVFDTKLGTSKTDRAVNFDTIKDFSAPHDASRLTQLREDFFAFGTKAKGSTDHILYDRKSGILAYDPDGSGSKAALEFAQVKKGTILTSQDLFIV